MRDPNAMIFSDSDGVISDFYAGAKKVLGHPWIRKGAGEHTKEEHGRILNQYEGFWETLPVMPDWELYWSFIEPYTPHILTALPGWDHDFAQVHDGKWKWYQTHIPSLPLNRFHVVHREKKADFARNGSVRNILIDDHHKNIDEFEAAGGIGIYHVSAKDTILKLKLLGYH